MHGGHGWLINQFLSPYFNHRTDEYGGCLENRVRLAREVLTAVREAVGPGFPIEFRMSGSELFEGGYDLDEGVRIAQAVDLEPMVHSGVISAPLMGAENILFLKVTLPIFIGLQRFLNLRSILSPNFFFKNPRKSSPLFRG